VRASAYSEVCRDDNIFNNNKPLYRALRIPSADGSGQLGHRRRVVFDEPGAAKHNPALLDHGAFRNRRRDDSASRKQRLYRTCATAGGYYNRHKGNVPSNRRGR